MDTLTIEEFRSALPANLKKSVNAEVLLQINTKLSEPDMYDTYRENLLSYVHVMREGKFKVSGYIDAVMYVSHKLMGRTNVAAFTQTFPDKIQRWQTTGVTAKDISSYVSAYNKSKLVGLLYEQTLTPFWVMNQALYQQAINTQAELMVDDTVSAKVRTDAANSLLTHLKPPETRKIELDVGMKRDSSIDALRESTQALVDMQRKMIESGSMNAQQIAHTGLIIENSEDSANEPEEAEFDPVPVAKVKRQDDVLSKLFGTGA